MDPVVNEGVSAFEPHGQFLANRLPQHGVNLGFLHAEHGREGRDVRDVPEAGEPLQRVLRRPRQARQLAAHQVHDVVGVTPRMDAFGIPVPLARIVIEGQEIAFGQRLQELDHEERIAARLVPHEARQSLDRFGSTVERVSNQMPDMRAGERREPDLLDLCACVTDSLKPDGQRMGGIHLVVAIGAYDHQVAQVRLAQQIDEQVQCRCIEPLQVVEKQRQRMVGLREHAR